jgi:hypothetical protein
MAGTGPRGNCEGEEDKGLAGRDLRGFARTLEDGDDRRRAEEEREVEAAAAAAVAVDMAVRAARSGRRRVGVKRNEGLGDVVALYPSRSRWTAGSCGVAPFCRF